MIAVEPYPRRWWALMVLCLALAMVGMDSLIVNVALPTLVRDLHASTSQLQWIVDAYTLAFAGALLTMGSLGDRFGRKRALYAGLLIFAGGSVAAAFVDSAGTLIAARAVMGLGGAVVCPSTLSIITNVFPERERARAISIWASFSVVGILLGPTVGGYLLGRFWWGSVFLINVPIVLAVLAAALLLVPESRDPEATPLDPMGALLSIGGLVSLVYGIIEAPGRGWTDPLILGSFALAAFLLTVFIGWERRRPYPMLNIELFRNLRFSAANASLTFMFFATNGILFLLTQHLQFVLGYAPLAAGVRLLPVAALVLTAALSPPIVHRVGTTAAVVTGMLIEALSGWLLTTASATSGYPRVAIALGLFGFGLGLAMAPATESIMGSLPLAKAGVGSAMNDTTRAVGGALGVAVVGSMMSSGYGSSIDPVASGLPGQVAEAARNSVGAAVQAAGQLGPAGDRLATAARAAFVDGMDSGLFVAVLVLVVGALAALLFLPARAASPATANRKRRWPAHNWCKRCAET